ncbi:MAG: AMP-binding protein [Croceibacterium sp.]
MANLFDALGIAQVDPERVFAVRNGLAPVTYGELTAESARYANALASCGVERGDRVAVHVEKCLEMLLIYLACLRLGAVFLPANPAYTDDELGFILSDANPAIVICAPETARRFEALRSGPHERFETLDTNGGGSIAVLAKGCASHFASVAVAADDLAAILYTSGTTGRPKGAMLTHGNLASNAVTLREYWRFEAGDRLLHALPIFHTHGLFVGTNVTLAAGASMLFLPRFEVGEVIAGLAQSSVMMGVPTFYIRLLGAPTFDGQTARSLRLFISGSAPLSAQVHREFERRTGHAILERYGMTETNMNTSNPYDGERRPGTVGFPLPGVAIRITDPASRTPLAAGEVGMIEIAGPNVFAGYWNRPDRRAVDFDGAFFASGDLGRVDEDGYLHIVGREKDLIISGGLNVYPAEIEGVIDALEPVRECAVIGVPHPDLGEGVVAVVATTAAVEQDAASLRALLRGKLAGYKQPKAVVFLDDLPRNAMGKVQKSVLRERFAGLFDA